MARLLGSLLLLAGMAVMVSGEVVFDVELEGHLKHLASQRYPSDTANQGRLDARKYIEDTFQYNGLRVYKQTFNTTAYKNPAGLGDPETVEGVNIIGIAEAVSNKPNAVILVGADYDTNGMDDPLYNNGAGVAAMLEVSKLFSFNTDWSGVFFRNYTTIFVAFDLNTKEHGYGPGKPGGWYFVNEWLWNYLNQSDVNFGGAIIIDSIMNVNYEEKSQDTGSTFQQLWPDVYERVRNDGEKGNFLGVVALGTEKEITLKDQFLGSYNKDRKLRPYRSEDMTLSRPTQFNNILTELTKSETIHFWSFEYNNVSKHLPAILITDTQALRERPPLPDGCIDRCPLSVMLTDEREEFMESTVIAITRLLFNRQGIYVPETDAAWTTLPSLLTMALTLLFVRLYH